jgi:hypothetical protein
LYEKASDVIVPNMAEEGLLSIISHVGHPLSNSGKIEVGSSLKEKTSEVVSKICHSMGKQ